MNKTEITKKILSSKSLLFRVMICFWVIIIFQLAIMNLFFTKNTAEVFQQNIDKFVLAYTQNISDGMDSYISELDRTSKIILGNQLIQDALARRDSSGYTELDRLADNELMQSVIFSFTSLRDSMTIVLLDESGTMVLRPENAFSGPNINLLENEYIQQNKHFLENGDFLVVPSHKTNIKNYLGESVFLFIRALRDIPTNEIEAYSVIFFDAKTLYSNFFKDTPKIQDMEIDITDQENTAIVSLNMDMIGKTAVDQNYDNYKGTSYRSELTGWVSHVRIPTDYLYLNFHETNRLLIPMILIILAGSVLLAVYLFFDVLNPIKRVKTAMKKVEKGHWEVRLHPGKEASDITSVYDGFNRMVQEIDYLTQTVLEEKILSKDAQIAALQYQINPHFLYNTLQTIEAIAEVKEVPEIQLISKSLGDLLRYNLRGTSQVKLYQEIQSMDTYLKIEEVRFHGDFQYFANIADSVANCTILKFILQPIVENCMVHGFKGFSEEKRILIDAYEQAGTLFIKVCNNGNLISPDRLSELNRSLSEISKDSQAVRISDSIGMINVHQRIVNRFGSSYGVQIERSDDQGTSIILSMPKIEEM